MSRIQSLMAEFDSKFLTTDPLTQRPVYPPWAVPYAREMLDTLNRARRQSHPPPALQSEVKRPSLHARYDSILDQYYPDKHSRLHSAASKPRATAASTAPAPRKARASADAHSNCVGHSHGRHSTEGTEEPGQRIRVTKLHSAMTEQINLLSGSLKEAWERIEEGAEAERAREAARGEGEGRLRAEVDEEVRRMREWREWNQRRMADLVDALQRVMGEQEEGQARVAAILAQQAELRGRYEEARRRVEELQAGQEREARAWEERDRAMQGREAQGREEGERLRRERDEHERQHHAALLRMQEMHIKLRALEADREATQQHLASVSTHTHTSAGLRSEASRSSALLCSAR